MFFALIVMALAKNGKKWQIAVNCHYVVANCGYVIAKCG